MEYIEGVIEDVYTKDVEIKKGKEAGTVKPMFFINIKNKTVSGFGAIPGPVQDAFLAKHMVRLAVEQSGKYLNYKNLQKLGADLENDGEDKDTQRKIDNGFTPAAEIKPFRDMLTGELVTLQQIANDAFKMAYNRDPKTDGEFQVVYGLQYVAGKHWAVERFLRAKGSMTIEQIYQEGIEKVQKNGT